MWENNRKKYGQSSSVLQDNVGMRGLCAKVCFEAFENSEIAVDFIYFFNLDDS